MTAALIERITGRRRAAEQKTLDTYRELVAAVADDTDVDPARADAILSDAAKTPSQLEADVAELRRRRIDAESAGRLPDLRDQREKLSQTLVSLREALRRAEAEWREKTMETNIAINALASEIQVCEQAEKRLRSGRPDPRHAELVAERNRLNQRRDQLAQEIGNNAQGLNGRLHNLRLALQHGPQQAADEFSNGLAPSIVPGLPYDEPTLRQAVDATEAHLRGAQSEQAKVDGRLAEVNATLAEIERNQLTP